MPQFDISTYYSQIFWLIIVFGFLYISIFKFVAPKAEQILNNRQNSISDDVLSAQEIALTIKELDNKYATELSQAYDKVKNMRSEAIASLNSSFAIKKADAHDRLKDQISKSLINIELDTQLFSQSVTDICLDLADSIIKKITSQQVDKELLKECYRKIA